MLIEEKSIEQSIKSLKDVQKKKDKLVHKQSESNLSDMQQSSYSRSAK